MQLPGMATEPIRVSIDLTYDPSRNDWSISERQWRFYSPTAEWRIEALYTSGTPLSNHTAAARFLELARNVARSTQTLAHPWSEEPFPQSP